MTAVTQFFGRRGDQSVISTPSGPMPPRPDGRPFFTGINAEVPLPLDERDHYASWQPLMRLGVRSGVQAQQGLDTFPDPWPIILLIETLHMGLVQEVADRIRVVDCSRIYVELGNELNGRESAAAMRQWYLEAIPILTAAGLPLNHIITCGIANIEPESLDWLRRTLIDIPLEVLCGWHAYSNWERNLPAFLALLGGRIPAMTEWGAFNITDDAASAIRIARELQLLYTSGSVLCAWYDNHSGTAAHEDFGIHNQFTGEWRLQCESTLRDAMRVA